MQNLTDLDRMRRAASGEAEVGERQLERVRNARTRMVGDHPDIGGPSLSLILRENPEVKT